MEHPYKQVIRVALIILISPIIGFIIYGSILSVSQSTRRKRIGKTEFFLEKDITIDKIVLVKKINNNTSRLITNGNTCIVKWNNEYIVATNYQKETNTIYNWSVIRYNLANGRYQIKEFTLDKERVFLNYLDSISFTKQGYDSLIAPKWW